MPEFTDFYSLIANRASNLKEKTFFIDNETGKTITFEEFHKNTNKVCNLLKKYKIEPKAKIALIMSNRPEWLYCNYGIIKYGAISAGLNPSIGAKEMIESLNRGEIDHIIIEEQHFEKIKKHLDEIEHLKKIFGVDFSSERVMDFEAEFDDAQEIFSPESKARRRETSIIIFDTGILGRPIAIPQTNKWLIEQAKKLIEYYKISEQDSFLCVQNLTDVDWTISTLIPLITGGIFVLTKKFSKTDFWNLVEKNNITIVNGTPANINMLLNTPENMEKKDITSLKTFLCGGALLSLGALKRFEQISSELTVCYIYRTNETGLIALTPKNKRLRRDNSAGLILPEIGYKLIDEEGKELKQFQEGELVITDCPDITPGYINSPQESRQQLRKDGFHTGDTCYVDGEDYVHIISMGSELINRGGEKISPKKVDSVIQEHQMVSDSKTIGIPNTIYGEEVISFVIVKYGLHATERDIKEHCKEFLAEHKCPKSVIFVEEFPKNKSDKIDIDALRERYFDKESIKKEEKTVFLDEDQHLY